MRLIKQLPEEVLIVQCFLTKISIVMHHPWQLAIIVVVIHLATQTVKGIDIPYEIQLAMTCTHPAVRTVFCVSIQVIGIVVLCIGIFTHS